MAQVDAVAVSIIVDLDNENNEGTLTPPCSIPTVNVIPVAYNDECVICFDEIETKQADGADIVVFDCKHQLCRECVVDYMRNLLKNYQDITCPICRTVWMSARSPSYQEHRRNLMKTLPPSEQTIVPIDISQTFNDDWQSRYMDFRRQRVRHIQTLRVERLRERERAERIKRWSVYAPAAMIIVIIISIIIISLCFQTSTFK